MRTWIALLRAVNVGGRNKLPMKALASELQGLGLSHIRTYIQSGNIVFRGPSKRATSLAVEIAATIEARFGFEPHVAVISDEDLAAAVAWNPFSGSTESDRQALHLFFLADAPRNMDLERLDAVRQHRERWKVSGRFLYLHAPDGVGNSKLAKQVERILRVSATARNWRTVCALLDLAKKSE